MRSLSISAPSERIMGSFKSQMASTDQSKKERMAIQLRFVSLHGLSREGTKIGFNFAKFWCPIFSEQHCKKIFVETKIAMSIRHRITGIRAESFCNNSEIYIIFETL